MNSGMMFGQLKSTETIPQGSIMPMGMGDGTGTKKVTKEVLEKELRESLKVGNLEDLQTENKENLVAAINEASQSGGGTAVDILDSKEEIEANTEEGKIAGAMAVKGMFAELNDNLQFPDGVKFYPDVQNGVRGYNTDAARGADTFHPFSSITGVKMRYANSLYGGSLAIPTFGRDIKVSIRLAGSNSGSSTNYSIGVINDYDYQIGNNPSGTVLKSGTVTMTPINATILCADYDAMYISGGSSSGGIIAVMEYL